MTLKEWKEISGLTWSDISDLIPCSKPYPSMVSRGKAHPSFKMACRFEEVSSGMVPRTNWYPAQQDTIGRVENVNVA